MDGKPSNATKERLAHVIEQNITESGKLARSLCQRSGSREVRYRASIFMAYALTPQQVLLKSAKKMASQEGAMENTLNVSHVYISLHTTRGALSSESSTGGKVAGQISGAVSLVCMKLH